MFEKINKSLAQIKRARPLVLNITNDVTMDFIANGLLALGASPVMSKAPQETADLLQLATCVVINLGTLDDEFIRLCQQTCCIANQLNKPVILDPVGAGASHYRTAAARQLINDHAIAIVRGNAGEIMALAGSSGATKGVDSIAQSNNAIASARDLAQGCNATIVISGEIDVVIDAENSAQFNRGSAMMPMITGTGCLLSAVVGAFHAVDENRFNAAANALVFYGVCGEIAAQTAQGPGSFKVNFLDALHATFTRDYYERT
jgi:hydroxyethylthiazole kinase